jgi:hypothetical protein
MALVLPPTFVSFKERRTGYIWGSDVFTANQRPNQGLGICGPEPAVGSIRESAKILDISSPIGPGKGGREVSSLTSRGTIPHVPETQHFHHDTTCTPWATPTTVPVVSPACGRSLLKGAGNYPQRGHRLPAHPASIYA